MPNRQTSESDPGEWLRFARSDYSIASRSPEPDVLLEALCFHAQQCVEKSFKAILAAHELPIPRTHDLAKLVTVILEGGIPVPEQFQSAVRLTYFAILVRYPGEWEPVTHHEWEQAVETAAAVLHWTIQLVGEKK